MFYVPKFKHVAALLSIDGEPKLATPFKFCHKDRAIHQFFCIVSNDTILNPK